jgi:predicted MPP superfamily phosphohydrolase
VERIGPRELALIAVIAELDPDIIVLTGDYINLSFVTDQTAQAQAREVLASVCEAGSCPVYAVTGSPPVDLASVVPDVFEGLPITWLDDASTEAMIRDHRLAITGLTCTRDRSLDAPRARRLLSDQPEVVFQLLLYHSPDLMPEAAEMGVDLYLCGHTHGGQIRLPLFGAIITSSDFWKRYEMGRYQVDGTTLYVNRGLGLEGMGAPRARLLSPPEVVVWELSGTG